MTDAKDRQRRGTLQLLLARLGFIVTGYAFTIILARHLGPADYGLYGVLLSILLWLEMLTSAGIPAATGRLIPNSPGRERTIERTARFLLLLVGVSMFALCWLGAPLLVRVFGIPDGATLFRLTTLDIPFAALYIADQGILTGHRRFGSLAAAQMIYGMAKLGGISILLLLGLSLPGVLIVNVLATCSALAFITLHGSSSGVHLDRPTSKRLISLAIPMGWYLVVVQILLSTPLWLLQIQAKGNGEVVGYYVAALQLARMLTVIPTVQSGVLFVSMGWALAQGDRVLASQHLKEATRFALVLIVPSCVILSVKSHGVLALLFSERYVEGAIFLSLQLVAFGAHALADAFSHALMAGGAQSLTAKIFTALVPGALVLNLVLLATIGPVGSAVALAASMLAGALITGVDCYRRFGNPVRLVTLARVLFAALAAGIAAALIDVQGAWLLLELLGLGILYLLILAGTGELSRADFQMPAVKSESA